MAHEEIPYQFAVMIFRGETADPAQHLGSFSAAVDWEPALQCASFEASRKAVDQPLRPDPHSARIEPQWSETLGPPYLAGVRVWANGDRKAAPMEIATSYFRGLAQAAGAQLLKAGKLANGQTFSYLVCAYPREPGEPSSAKPAGGGLTVKPIGEPLRLTDRSMEPFLARSVASGQIADDAMAVFVPHHVLGEAAELAQQAGSSEAGGILVGHLHRDRARPDIFLEVTAQIPARHTQEELTRLTFTPQTWSDVDAAIHLRAQNELYLGWWHSHPARQWCKDCPPEKRRNCQLTGAFFSSHDVALHRCVFPRAYSIAVVISDSPAAGLTWPMFGWRGGMVVPRGYYILDGEPASASGDGRSPSQKGGEP